MLHTDTSYFGIILWLVLFQEGASRFFHTRVVRKYSQYNFTQAPSKQQAKIPKTHHFTKSEKHPKTLQIVMTFTILTYKTILHRRTYFLSTLTISTSHTINILLLPIFVIFRDFFETFWDYFSTHKSDRPLQKNNLFQFRIYYYAQDFCFYYNFTLSLGETIDSGNQLIILTGVQVLKFQNITNNYIRAS